MKKLLLLALIFTVNFSISQTIEISGNKITFGKSFDEVKGNLWSDGGQIESGHPYVEIYESDIIDGAFYKDRLVTLYSGTYPEIEKLLQNIEPYKEYTNPEDITTHIQLFKSSEFFISQSKSSVSTEYIIVPINILTKIQKEHPEYLKQFTE